MLRRSILMAVVLTVIVALTGVQPSTAAPAAVRPFAPPQTVVGGCSADSADAVGTGSGGVAGFVACRTASGLSIRFFSRTSGGTVNPSEPTGFRGRVLGVASDATASYVLYNDVTQIRIGKRTNAGAFSSRAVANWFSGALFPTGDVIARNGEWFGVWSNQVGPGGEFAQTELFSSGTGLPVERRTTTAGNVDDSNPTLAYSGAVPVLIWTRSFSPQMPGPSNLMVKKRVGGVWEPDRVFATAGTSNGSPDMAIAGSLTFVTWTRDGATMVASNATVSFTSHRFLTPGFGPKVAAASSSGGAIDHVFVSWTATTAAGDRVFFAESATIGSVQGTWDGTFIAPTGTTTVGVGAAATKATVVYDTGTSVASRSQT